jgi:hypothetical protein
MPGMQSATLEELVCVPMSYLQQLVSMATATPQELVCVPVVSTATLQGQVSWHTTKNMSVWSQLLHKSWPECKVCLQEIVCVLTAILQELVCVPGMYTATPRAGLCAMCIYSYSA